MIRTELEPYCRDCMIFEAETDRPEAYYERDENDKLVVKYSRKTIYIHCKYAKACEEIYSRMKEKIECTTENSQL